MNSQLDKQNCSPNYMSNKTLSTFSSKKIGHFKIWYPCAKKNEKIIQKTVTKEIKQEVHYRT